MPTYEYKCQDNQHPFTEIRGINDKQQQETCPECGSSLMRVFSAPPIQFKGSGYASSRPNV